MENIQAWGIGLGVLVGVAVFTKFLPTEKLGQNIYKYMRGVGEMVSKLLLRYIPARSAEKIETGVINSLLYWLEMAIKGFRLGMLEDNKHHKGKDGKK